ncbi:hypothetical protein [Streptomyces roseolilacinus]|uniref:Secreted protein n=1 Tax=Streptomyces roseolilacinus TaxID=66904 RepID=A0A918AZE1_9ACTN|nr:hypothetical protein [Streptomyces roseolilacinus]GGP96713.1 hypothetical protein GCM10010249_13700 [Streptomyces roseolilacinus]
MTSTRTLFASTALALGALAAAAPAHAAGVPDGTDPLNTLSRPNQLEQVTEVVVPVLGALVPASGIPSR